MKINIKCFADLAKEHACDYRAANTFELADGVTVSKLVTAYGIPEESVRIVFVNGRITDMAHPLRNNDNVTLVPATGGM